MAPLTLLTLLSTGASPLEAHDVALPEVALPVWPAADEATLTVSLEGLMDGMQMVWTLNGKAWPGDPMDIAVPLGQLQTLDIVNDQAQEHPLHIHGQFFQIVSRNGEPADEPGLKDTVLVHGNQTVRIVVNFDNPGMWMVHCHILEHAETGMMGMFEVH